MSEETTIESLRKEIEMLRQANEAAVRQEQINRNECNRLRGLIVKERAAVARFLVPWKHRLPDCWLSHFEEEGIVEFDGIGFVKAKPL